MFRTLDDLDARGMRVVVRSDLNVPAKDGKVTDSTRIDRSAGTIRELAEKGARVIVLTPFRPAEGTRGEIQPEAPGGAFGQGARTAGGLGR